MKQIALYLFFAGFISCMGAYAQKIVYAYDASGNCISRTYQAPSGLKSTTTDKNGVNTTQNVDTILQTDENSIKIYPNPNNGQFQVEMTGFDEALSTGMITVFSAQGQAVLKSSSLKPINSINLNSLPNGTYVLKINIGEKTFHHKIIVNK